MRISDEVSLYESISNCECAISLVTLKIKFAVGMELFAESGAIRGGDQKLY